MRLTNRTFHNDSSTIVAMNSAVEAIDAPAAGSAWVPDGHSVDPVVSFGGGATRGDFVCEEALWSPYALRWSACPRCWVTSCAR
jgi:hypothetical protein